MTRLCHSSVLGAAQTRLVAGSRHRPRGPRVLRHRPRGPRVLQWASPTLEVHVIPGNDAVSAFLVRRAALTPDDCEALLRVARTRTPEVAEVIADAALGTERRSTVRWLDDRDASVIARVRDVLQELNEGWFHFDVDGIEPIQIARYGPGDRYDSHIDLGPGEASRRKLSLTIQLSDPNTYEGGDLAFRGVSPPGARARGAAVVFPSYLGHAVEPVRTGERWSLVAWAVGPPFR